MAQIIKSNIVGRILKHSVFENFVSLLVLQGVNYIIPLFAYPFLFRMLGVDKFGLFNFAWSFIQYFLVLTDFGFNFSAVKKISENKHNPAIIERIYNNVLYAKILLTSIGFVILLTIIYFNNKFADNYVLFLASYIMVCGSTIFPTWFFQGMEKMKIITIINALSKVVAFIPMFFLVRNPEHFTIVPFFFSAGYVISGIVGIFVVRYSFKIKVFKPKIKAIFLELKESFLYFLSRVSLSIYTTTSVVIIGFVLTDTMVGYYSAAEKIYIAITGLYAPFILAIYPYMSRTKNRQLLKKIIISATILNTLGIILLILLASQIMTIIYGNASIEMIKTFKIMLFACFVYVPSVLFGYPLLGTMGHEKQANSSVIYASLFHILLLTILLLTKNLSIYSVAISIVITGCFEFSLRLFWVTKFKLLKL